MPPGTPNATNRAWPNGAVGAEEPAQREAGRTKMEPATRLIPLVIDRAHREATEWGQSTNTGVPIEWGHRAIGEARNQLLGCSQSRWVGGRAGTAVPRGAVCELPNPPKLLPCQASRLPSNNL